MSEYIPMLGQEEIPDSPLDDSGCPKPMINPKYLILPEYKDYFQYQPQLTAKTEIDEPQVMLLFLIIVLFGVAIVLFRKLIKKIWSSDQRGRDEL